MNYLIKTVSNLIVRLFVKKHLNGTATLFVYKSNQTGDDFLAS
jgi:hypothetical protein